MLVGPTFGMSWSRLGSFVVRCIRCLAITLTIAFVLLALPTRASADEAAARAHFRRGVELYDAKRFEAALIEFQTAYEKQPSATIKQNIALTLKALERPADAASAFDEALEEDRGTLSPERRAAIAREL